MQIAKEINAALSDDKLREQWLKRMLPGLVITVIYFVFVSNILTGKTDKAENEYRAIIGKGISEQALPGMQQQIGQLQSQLAELKSKDKALQDSLADKAGFLFGKNDEIATVDRISLLMQKHHLLISDEKTLNDRKVSELPHSAADLKKWLNDSLKADETVRIHRIEFVGAYPDVYAALRDLALGDYKVLPVFVSMKDSESRQPASIGMKAWTLDLWI
ncbi:MAG: hypothetical protein ACU83V_00165 [Gammaproteobacteria bacterium]